MIYNKILIQQNFNIKIESQTIYRTSNPLMNYIYKKR